MRGHHERKRAEEKLRRSEGRCRYIFQAAGVSIWEEDFSRVKVAIDELKAGGVRDVRRSLADHPDFVRQAISWVRIVDVNDLTLTLFEAESKEQLVASLDRLFVPETLEVFAGELIALAERRSSFDDLCRIASGSATTAGPHCGSMAWSIQSPGPRSRGGR